MASSTPSSLIRPTPSGDVPSPSIKITDDIVLSSISEVDSDMAHAWSHDPSRIDYTTLARCYGVTISEDVWSLAFADQNFYDAAWGVFYVALLFARHGVPSDNEFYFGNKSIENIKHAITTLRRIVNATKATLWGDISVSTVNEPTAKKAATIVGTTAEDTLNANILNIALNKHVKRLNALKTAGASDGAVGQIASLTTELEAVKAAYAALQAAREGDGARLTGEIRTVSSQYDEAKAAYDKLAKERAALIATLTRLQGESNTAQAAFTGLNEELTTTKKEIKRLQEANSQAVSADVLAKAKDENKALRAERDALKTAATEVGTSLDNLSDSHKDCIAKRDKLGVSAKLLQTSVGQHSTLRRKLDSIVEAISVVTDTRDTMQIELEDISAKGDALKASAERVARSAQTEKDVEMSDVDEEEEEEEEELTPKARNERVSTLRKTLEESQKGRLQLINDAINVAKKPTQENKTHIEETKGLMTTIKDLQDKYTTTLKANTTLTEESEKAKSELAKLKRLLPDDSEMETEKTSKVPKTWLYDTLYDRLTLVRQYVNNQSNGMMVDSDMTTLLKDADVELALHTTPEEVMEPAAYTRLREATSAAHTKANTFTAYKDVAERDAAALVEIERIFRREGDIHKAMLLTTLHTETQSLGLVLAEGFHTLSKTTTIASGILSRLANQMETTTMVFLDAITDVIIRRYGTMDVVYMNANIHELMRVRVSSSLRALSKRLSIINGEFVRYAKSVSDICHQFCMDAGEVTEGYRVRTVTQLSAHIQAFMTGFVELRKAIHANGKDKDTIIAQESRVSENKCHTYDADIRSRFGQLREQLAKHNATFASNLNAAGEALDLSVKDISDGLETCYAKVVESIEMACDAKHEDVNRTLEESRRHSTIRTKVLNAYPQAISSMTPLLRSKTMSVRMYADSTLRKDVDGYAEGLSAYYSPQLLHCEQYDRMYIDCFGLKFAKAHPKLSTTPKTIPSPSIYNNPPPPTTIDETVFDIDEIAPTTPGGDATVSAKFRKHMSSLIDIYNIFLRNIATLDDALATCEHSIATNHKTVSITIPNGKIDAILTHVVDEADKIEVRYKLKQAFGISSTPFLETTGRSIKQLYAVLTAAIRKDADAMHEQLKIIDTLRKETPDNVYLILRGSNVASENESVDDDTSIKDSSVQTYKPEYVRACQHYITLRERIEEFFQQLNEVSGLKTPSTSTEWAKASKVILNHVILKVETALKKHMTDVREACQARCTSIANDVTAITGEMEARVHTHIDVLHRMGEAKSLPPPPTSNQQPLTCMQPPTLRESNAAYCWENGHAHNHLLRVFRSNGDKCVLLMICDEHLKDFYLTNKFRITETTRFPAKRTSVVTLTNTL